MLIRLAETAGVAVEGVKRVGSEACISLFGGWAYCSADGGVTVRRLELEFSRLEPHEGGVGEVYRPKRRSIFAKAKEYIRIL